MDRCGYDAEIFCFVLWWGQGTNESSSSFGSPWAPKTLDDKWANVKTKLQDGAWRRQGGFWASTAIEAWWRKSSGFLNGKWHRTIWYSNLLWYSIVNLFFIDVLWFNAGANSDVLEEDQAQNFKKTFCFAKEFIDKVYFRVFQNELWL